MAKSKPLTPQEIYKQRRQREESEKVAYLPPGLINHGNTCFMNSVLQGLIATRLLADLVHFAPIPPEIQTTASTPIVSRRSPQLTNGHNLAGKFEQPWLNTMPIGDMFLTLMYKAWDSQAARKRDVLSPKSILSALGQKYDQYLDFAQQDAHEFLRILLDAMRMEEQDIIKKRQRPSPPKKRRRTTITPESLDNPTDAPVTPTEPPLLSFVDMIFGGELTSILVCQKCKHVSQTYEEFNDISLSIKAEDYFPHNRKRDRLKKIVGRLTQFPGNGITPKPHTRLPTTPAHTVEMLRASSVPPSPRTERDAAQLLAEHPRAESPRRRSFDVPAGEADSESDSPVLVPQNPTEESSDLVVMIDPVPEKAEDEPNVAVDATEVDEKHVEFLEPTSKKERHESSSVVAITDKEKERVQKNDDMGWAKLGRRISLSVGLGRSRGPDREKDKEKAKEKDKKDRDRKSRSMDRAGLGVPTPIKEGIAVDLGMQKSHSNIEGVTRTSIAVDDSTTSARSRAVSDGAATSARINDSASASTNSTMHGSSQSKSIPVQSPPSTSSTATVRSSSPHSSTTQPHNLLNMHTSSAFPSSIFPGVQRSKSPKPPKPNAAQTEYLRKILADVSASSTSANPFAIFKPPLLHSHSHHHGGTPTLQSSGGPGEKEKDKSTGTIWLGMGRNFTGIEECLRLFTAVEVLDGDNMVGCRRCWKIQNGVLHTSKNKESDHDDEDEEEEVDLPQTGTHTLSNSVATKEEPAPNDVTKQQETPEKTRPLLKCLTPTHNAHIPTSLSTPTVSFYSHVDDTDDTRSVSSLPTEPASLLVDETGEDSPLSLSIISESDSSSPGPQLAGPGGLPIPKISTTSPPDTPTESSTSVNSRAESIVTEDSNEGEHSSSSVPAPLLNSRHQKVIYGSKPNSLSKDSLSIPSKSWRISSRRSSYSDATTTDGESSDDESDTSVDTTLSADSVISKNNLSSETRKASAENGSAKSSGQPLTSQQAAPSTSTAKKPSKPKLVIMRPAYKRYLIAKPPPILVIHLKRFQQTSKSPFMSFSHGFKKLDDYISFPEYLDLLPFLAPRKEDYGLGKKSKEKSKTKEERCMYRLYSVVVHIGNMLGGHYVAYTALPTDTDTSYLKGASSATSASNSEQSASSALDSNSATGDKTGTTELVQPPKNAERQWAHISDTAVRLTTLEEVLRAKAYICMYERC